MKTESQESQGELSELSNADLEEVCGGYGYIYDGDLVDADSEIGFSDGDLEVEVNFKFK